MVLGFRVYGFRFSGFRVGQHIRFARIFTYIYHNNQLNVGKYTSPMDPMGLVIHHLLFFPRDVSI